MTCWSSVELVAGEAEIDLLALLVERHALQPEGDGAVLDIGEGLRVVDFELDLAVRRRGVLVEQLAHALGIDAVGRDRVAEPGRVVEPQRDRLVDLGRASAACRATACRAARRSGRARGREARRR